MSFGTVSSIPFTVNAQVVGVAFTSLQTKTPLPDTTQALFVLNGSNSILAAQWIDWPATQVTPLGSSVMPLPTKLRQVAPPFVLR